MPLRRGEAREIVRFDVVLWSEGDRSSKPVRAKDIAQVLWTKEVACVLPRSVAQVWPRKIEIVKPKEKTDE